MKDVENLKILLVQIRKDVNALPAERAEFVQFSRLKEEQIVTLDVFRNPDFSASILDDHDALMIGGLSDDTSHEITLPSSFEPFLENIYQLMQRAITKEIPSLLSCGGFMLASMMLGGSVIIDPSQSEIGLVAIKLTDQAKTDILFDSMPVNFQAVSGHIKSTKDLPSSCVPLASSEQCLIHGFKVQHAPFYAFQFHPEITCEDLMARVEVYREKYFDNDQAYQAFIQTRGSTEIANSIITRFVDLVARGQI